MEEWRDIQGYEGLYQVSNNGRVKRVGHSVKYKNGVEHFYKERMLSPNLQNTGYLTVTLCSTEGQRIFSIHRLVAEAFIPNVSNAPQVNHKDGDKTNNNVENIEWCTASENSSHAWRNGLSKVTERHRESARKMCLQRAIPVECVETGEVFDSAAEAARHLGIWNQNISKVLHGTRKSAGGYRFRYAIREKEN